MTVLQPPGSGGARGVPSVPSFIQRPNGHHLHAVCWGNGPPMVLMAGWAMDSRIWSETMLHLNRLGFTTIAYDRNGHGRSTDRDGYHYDALADDLAAVMDCLHLTDVTLVAHSGAGGEAIRYLSRNGGARIRRLVMVGATGPRVIGAAGITREAVDALCIELSFGLTDWIDANIEPFAPGAPKRVQEWMASMALNCSRRALVAFQRTIAETDLTLEAAALKLPVTIIHGDRDVSAPIDVSAKVYASIIPRSELIVYQGAPHGIMVTEPERLAHDISGRL